MLDRRIWFLASGMLLLMALLSTRIVWWQLVRGLELQPVALDLREAARRYGELEQRGSQPGELPKPPGESGDLAQLPAPVIQRTADLLASIARGSIVDATGRLLAYDTLDADGNRQRFFTEPSLAHVVGYVSGLRNGVIGLEASYNDTLLGFNRADTQLGQLIHQPIVGSDLILTIDSGVQRAAQDALGDRAGAIVVLDGHSGAVLAMASSPRFDPNRILEPGYVEKLLNACGGNPACASPLLNRATQALYVPGSTFKTVTLEAALDTGQVTPQTVFDFGKPTNTPNGPVYYYQVGGGVIPDPNHRESKLDLTQSYSHSANAAFARMGDEMDPETFIRYAEKLGFSTPRPFSLEIEFTPSTLAQDVESIRSNDLLRAATAIGQGELLVTPLNMAMVVLPALNKGDMPIPYFVDSVRDPFGNVAKVRGNRDVVRNIIKDKAAQQVHDIMLAVVNGGAGSRAAVQGLTVGGKTGTAQLGGNQEPHAWFIGYAEKGDQAVAIAVLVENGGSGANVAAPLFAQVANAAMNHRGEPVDEVLPLPPPAGQPFTSPTVSGEAPAAQAAAEGALPSPTPIPLLPADMLHDQAKVDFTIEGPGTCKKRSEGAPGTGNFTWPSDYHKLSGGAFMVRHPGVDLAAPSGSAVYAADAGVVIFAGWSNLGYGNTVVIDHRNGYRTLYGHLSQISTSCGAYVEAGQVIALSGNTGNSRGPHLHFEVRVPDGYVDPFKALPAP